MAISGKPEHYVDDLVQDVAVHLTYLQETKADALSESSINATIKFITQTFFSGRRIKGSRYLTKREIHKKERT